MLQIYCFILNLQYVYDFIFSAILYIVLSISGGIWFYNYSIIFLASSVKWAKCCILIK